MTLEWYPNPPVVPMSLEEIENYLLMQSEWRLPTRSELFNAFENNESGFFTAGFYWTNLKEMKAVYGKKIVSQEKFLCRLVRESSVN